VMTPSPVLDATDLMKGIFDQLSPAAKTGD